VIGGPRYLERVDDSRFQLPSDRALIQAVTWPFLGFLSRESHSYQLVYYMIFPLLIEGS
jgi:hypothetical protein